MRQNGGHTPLPRRQCDYNVDSFTAMPVRATARRPELLHSASGRCFTNIWHCLAMMPALASAYATACGRRNTTQISDNCAAQSLTLMKSSEVILHRRRDGEHRVRSSALDRHASSRHSAVYNARQASRRRNSSHDQLRQIIYDTRQGDTSASRQTAKPQLK